MVPNTEHDIALFIDGTSIPAAGDEWFDAVDPTTGRAFAKVALGLAEDVDRAVTAARRAAAGPWPRWPLARRLAVLAAIAAGIEAQAERFVAAEVRDTGRPLSMARGFDIPRAAATFREFARFAANLPGESLWCDTPDGSGAISYTLRVPLGVVGLICPWNLPLVLLVWKLAPALAAGNTVVVKPSEDSPSTATLLGEVMRAAGLPDGVYNVVHGFGPDGAGEAIVRHPDVAGVSFTGETATGRAIMAAAAPTLKKLSFELGGKNAAVVFADADLEQAIPTVARSVFQHAGQLCLCNERVYVERPIYDRFVTGLVAAARATRPGPPEDPDTRIGPLINRVQLDKVRRAQQRAVEDGADVLAGGGVPELPAPWSDGFFVEPTVWAGLDPDSALWRDEVFGPVCAIAPFDDDDQALALVNRSSHGLTASVWTRDGARGARFARAAAVGVVWINSWLIRDLRTPFGGVGQSGFGREGGTHSFEFFSELRQVTHKL